MTKEDMAFWMEIGKLVASIATPFVVAILGVLLLHRIEGVKSKVAKQSDFHKKWAEQFFGCCQEFMNALERQLAVLVFLAQTKPNDEMVNELRKEVTSLNITILELHVRIGRSVVFTKKQTGLAVTQAANACYELLKTGLDSRRLNPQDLINKMNEFNAASRKAHEEMLELSDKRTWLGRIRSMCPSKQ